MAFIELSVDPVVLALGGYALRWYGVFLALGVLGGLMITFREARRRGLPEDKVNAATFWALAAGLVGARLFHVADYPDYYRLNPQLILALHQGGMSLFGGLLVGGGAAALACRQSRLPFARALDAAVPGLVFGVGLGRLGSLINGDGAGNPVALPWAVVYRHPDSLAYRLDLPVHPYPAYEIILGLAILGVVLLGRGRLQAPGLAFGLWALLFGLGRLALAFARPEPLWFSALRPTLVFGLLLILVGLGFIRQARRARNPDLSVPEPTASGARHGA